MPTTPIFHKPVIVPKAWGREEVICNNADYCGKRLVFKKGAKFSMHAHAVKHETFLVVKGLLLLATINTDNADLREHFLETGMIVEIPRLLPHQLTAVEDSEVIEFSTHHEDSDSYRYARGDSQVSAINAETHAA